MKIGDKVVATANAHTGQREGDIETIINIHKDGEKVKISNTNNGWWVINDVWRLQMKTLEEQLQEAQEILEGIKNQIKEEEVSKFWEPEEGEKAWFASLNGRIYPSSSWSTYEIKLGCGFQTKELAEQDYKRRVAVQALKKRIFELNKRVDSSFVFGKRSFFVTLTVDGLGYSYATNIKFFPNWFYLKSEALCEQLIKEMPEELMLYLNE